MDSTAAQLAVRERPNQPHVMLQRWERLAFLHWPRFRYRLDGRCGLAEPGTVEFFLAERYLLFAQTPRGLRCGRVHHSPCPLVNVELETWDATPLLQAGFADPGRPPDHRIGSPGLDVRVYPLTG